MKHATLVHASASSVRRSPLYPLRSEDPIPRFVVSLTS